MNDNSIALNKHYGSNDLSARILNALEKAGKDTDNLKRDDISTFEEFHIGGRGETRQLASESGLAKGMKVLDIGSGIGGPARTLASEFGCSVTGLDITEEFCLAAEMLTKKVDLSDSVRFVQGSALRIPFGDNKFDAVWMQHAAMNIEDKALLFSEVKRVLKPEGLYIFHEIMAGETDILYYPVFWADEASLSHLVSPSVNHKFITQAGFEQILWDDVSERSYGWFQNIAERIAESGPPPLGLNVIVAREMPAKVMNITKNLAEKNIVVFQGSFRAK